MATGSKAPQSMANYQRGRTAVRWGILYEFKSFYHLIKCSYLDSLQITNYMGLNEVICLKKKKKKKKPGGKKEKICLPAFSPFTTMLFNPIFFKAGESGEAENIKVFCNGSM